MRKTRPTKTLQLWPGGRSLEYRGDPDGPANQKSLRDPGRNGQPDGRWRKGTADEWRQIRIEERAEMYQRNYILACQSSLVGDLIRHASEGERGDLSEGFAIDEIRNMYRDFSDADAATCREYADDHGLELPEVPTVDCPDCAPHDDSDCTCQTCRKTGEIPDPDADEDESWHGWLTEARDVCTDHAQDNPQEAYEWWLVDSWLCDQLHAIGEITIDNGYGHWWGRGGTGQRLIMDGTLQQIAGQYERMDEK